MAMNTRLPSMGSVISVGGSSGAKASRGNTPPIEAGRDGSRASSWPLVRNSCTALPLPEVDRRVEFLENLEIDAGRQDTGERGALIFQRRERTIVARPLERAMSGSLMNNPGVPSRCAMK